jgi:hypothetical protein
VAAIINDPSVQVLAGEIDVDVIDVVLDTECAKAWNVGLSSKYARVSSYGVTGDKFQFHYVHLAADDHTLYVDEKLRGRSTEIGIEVPGDGWIVMAECAKRTCRIVAYKPTYYKD